MATYKMVNADQLDADLQTVANKIREKADLTDQLLFPDGFVDGIDQCSSLDVEVVGSTTKPAAPKENTIWLNTPTDVPEWWLGPDVPRIERRAEGNVISVSDAKSADLIGLRIFGKTTQDGTPTPESPVALENLGDSVKVTICGRNLVDVFNENMSVMRDGKTNTSYPNIVNEDGSLTINVSGSVSYGQGFVKKLFAGQTVTISYFIDNIGNGSAIRLRIFDTNDYSTPKVSEDVNSTGKVTHTFTADADSIYMFGWFILSGTVPCGGKIHDLQLEVGSAATEYESYKDGVLTATTPNGLPGIPVSSGGNYTDENGQQWICDEVNLGTGKYVQRIGIADKDSGWKYYDNGTNPFAYVTPSLLGFSFSSFNGTINRTERMNLMSNCLAASNSGSSLAAGTFSVSDYMYIKVDGFTSVTEYTDWMAEKDFQLLYILENPVYQELSEEVLAQFASLQANNPNTTVINDAGAGMEVRYEAAYQEGFAWVITGNASAVKLNALKKNGIQVYPLSARQYESGAWVDTPAEIYQNGRWLEWSIALFPPASNWDSLTNGRGSVTVSDDAITLNEEWISYSQYQQVTSKTKWDTAPYSKLCARMKSSDNTCTKVLALSAASDSNVLSSSFVAKTTDTTQTAGTVLECDISSISGEYYVVVGQSTSSGASNSATIFDKVWME